MKIVTFFSIKWLLLLLVLQGAATTRTDSSITYVGSEHAGWFLPQEYLLPKSICYCFGAGEDITFELALAERYRGEVYCFDPAPWSITYVTDAQAAINSVDTYVNYSKELAVWEHFHFYPYGVWTVDGMVNFYSPLKPKFLSHSIVNGTETGTFFEGVVKKLSTIMHELGHSHIDLLKLDIEGAEYEVIENMLDEHILPTIICLEFHRVAGYDKNRLINRLKECGYKAWFIHKKSDYTLVRNGQTTEPCNSECGKV